MSDEPEDVFDDEREDEPEGARSLYVLTASRAPVAAVFLRVPGKWWHVLRWDLMSGELTSGAWLKGTLYPRRSDLSPNGRLLVYFLSKDGKGAFMGMHGRHTFTAISKLPWVHALAAWPADGTDTDGHHFAPPGAWDLGTPQHGDVGDLPDHLGIKSTAPEQYAAERRRGWVEHERCPPRAPNDPFDEERSVILVKPAPTAKDTRLVLTDEGWDPDAPGAVDGRAPSYTLEREGETTALDDVVWADWHPSGLLMVATEDSRLEVREPTPGKIVRVWDRDLSSLEPRARPAPDWATEW